MPFQAKTKQRNLVSKPQDEVLATNIVQALAESDREIIFQSYVERRSPADIELDMGLTPGYVRHLKSSIKARFFAERQAAL